MTRKKFLASAKALEIDVDGNTLRVRRVSALSRSPTPRPSDPRHALGSMRRGCLPECARVGAHVAQGEPRSFSSGAMGWYLGGKVEMKIGDHDIWAQVGLNCVIPGSNAWKD